MYSSYQDRADLEDDLYNEDEGDSEVSENDSELEFRLYSQLHYSAHLEDTEADEGKCQQQDVDKEAEVKQPLSNVELVEEHLQVKAVERNKRKKNDLLRDTKPFLFEEVIVIDSGPDITVSEEDAANDNDSICAAKCQQLSRGQTSTPSQQTSQKRLEAPEVVDLCSSDSESESSSSESCSDSSDSDSLENWMILGQDKEDGDQSISLNLDANYNSATDYEDATDEERISSWGVSSKDREAGIFNKEKGIRNAGQRDSKRYYTAKDVRCRNCDKTGHLSKNCPQPKKTMACFLCGTPGHIASKCPNKYCNNCGLPGHLYTSCSEKAYWHKQCHRCGMKGHFFDACPEIWRQYHVTTKTGPPVKQAEGDNDGTSSYCYNCSKKGHCGHACTQKRMFNGTFPSTPFINHYDSVNDAVRRGVRIQMKVKDLKKKGCFTESSNMTLTPEQPRKKLKIHQSKATPQQTKRKTNQKPSHIFFSDNHDFKTLKKNQHKPPVDSGSVKPWKPKRPVPKSRAQFNQNKLLIDEAADFPRGGESTRENGEKKRKKQRKDPRLDFGNGKPGHLRRSRAVELKESKKEKTKKRRFSGRKAAGVMEPTDDNLFCIKQRKPTKKCFS